MGVDNTVLGSLSSPHAIEVEGKTYTIGLIDQRAKAEWEKRLFRRAVDAAHVIAESKPDGWLDGKLDELSEAYQAGQFALLDETSLKLLQKPGGVSLLLSILTGKEISDLLPLLSERAREVRAVLKLVIKESFPGVKVENLPDPN